ncbi:MAG: hypothetical protein ABIP37_07595 [Methylotenera sp.]
MFQLVLELGGLKAATDQLFSQQGKENKIAFLKKFPGIGPKYARNIMMDVYHEDFRNSIAIDVRINAITELLGLKFPDYEKHEQFYLEVAEEAGLNGWEVDRLLYNFRPIFERKLIQAQE